MAQESKATPQAGKPKPSRAAPPSSQSETLGEAGELFGSETTAFELSEAEKTAPSLAQTEEFTMKSPDEDDAASFLLNDDEEKGGETEFSDDQPRSKKRKDLAETQALTEDQVGAARKKT